MKSILCVLRAGLLMMIALAPLSARETAIPDGYPTLVRSLRAQGMGNSMLTMPARDTNDMFYNPASLHSLPHGWRTTVMGIQGGISKNIITVGKDVINLANDLDDATISPTTASDLDLFDTFFTKHVGKFNTVQTTISPFSMGRKDWGVSLVTDTTATIALRNAAFSNFELHARSDTVVGFGHAQSLLGGDLVIGALLKGIYRIANDRVITSADIIAGTLETDIKWSAWDKSAAVGGDIGVNYRLPIVGLNPVVAVVLQDVGNTRFFKSGMDNIPQSLNAAIGFHPSLGEFGLSVEAGMSQLNRKIDLLPRLHAGAEVRLPKLGPLQVAVRAGANQGYPTAGASFDFKYFVLDAAYYSEETGMTKRSGKNTIYAAGFGFRF